MERPGAGRASAGAADAAAAGAGPRFRFQYDTGSTTGNYDGIWLGGTMAKLYVAYGSNLNKEQMRYRCPTAKFVGTGIIEGYELQFKGALHGACATIAPKEGAAVPVGIWTIQKPDEKRLDLYEGYHEHGHSFYDKEQIAVKMDDGSIPVSL